MAGKNNNASRVEQLLNMAWNSTNDKHTVSLARQVLEISPDNTDALLLIADNTENHEERIKIIKHAIDTLNKNEKYDDDEKLLFLLTLNYRLSYTYFAEKKLDEALFYSEESLKIIADSDDSDVLENYEDVKALYYRILIERKEWKRILADTMKDEIHGLSWAYARLIAAWFTAPGMSKSVCSNMFWDALILSPDVPFYMLGYLEEPDGDADESTQEDFDFALMYYDALSISEDFMNWFTRGVILFGLLTGRFDEREREYVLDVIDTLGGYEEYEKMSSILVEGDDRAVIEMLAANKCLSK